MTVFTYDGQLSDFGVEARTNLKYVAPVCDMCETGDSSGRRTSHRQLVDNLTYERANYLNRPRACHASRYEYCNETHKYQD